MSGFQFVLSRLGCRVVNVDPGQKELRQAWEYGKEDFAGLNKRFGTNVEMRPTTIDKAGLEDNSFDCVYSISVLEHLSSSAVSTIMTYVWRCLKPGGRFILTVDLFINLLPFTRRIHNEYGSNVDIRWLLDQAPFALQQGSTKELYGFDDFSAQTILSNLETYLVADDYPALTQCIVLRKRAEN
jgi:SAM-dependent methyltransferase